MWWLGDYVTFEYSKASTFPVASLFKFPSLQETTTSELSNHKLKIASSPTLVANGTSINKLAFSFLLQAIWPF